MEIFRSLGALIERPTAELAPLAALLELGSLPDEAAHTELFGFQLYPYASIYLGEEGMLGGEARDRIAGFWRALGQKPPGEPDHLTVMLAFHAELCERATNVEVKYRQRWLQARKAFLWEHLIPWLPIYLLQLDRLAPPFYRRWGQLLREALRGEVEAVGLQERPALHLRSASGIADPRKHDFKAFLDSLLAPVRSGLLLTRYDLSRAARNLNLGSRIGERRYILQALLAQQTGDVLAWIGREATARSEQFRATEEPWSPMLALWGERAEATAALAKDLSLIESKSD